MKAFLCVCGLSLGTALGCDSSGAELEDYSPCSGQLPPGADENRPRTDGAVMRLPEHCGSSVDAAETASHSDIDGSVSEDVTSGGGTACQSYKARRLNVEAQCLEEMIEFGCDTSGCDDESANALDDEGNCYRMFSCAPLEWQSSVEETLPEQCDGLSFDNDIALCSDVLDAGDGG